MKALIIALVIGAPLSLLGLLFVAVATASTRLNHRREDRS